MNPLSAWTFYRRHKRRAALLMSLICLVTVGVYLMGALTWGVFGAPGRSNYMILSRFSVVSPEYWESGVDPAVIAPVRVHPDVARVIPTTAIEINLPQVIGGGFNSFYLLGLAQEDLSYVLERCGATLKQGQWLEPRTNGLLLSEKVAANLNLQVGDTIQDSVNRELYGSVSTPLQVVGILKSDVRLGIVSLEFLNSHESYPDSPTRFLVVAQEKRQAAVDNFLRREVQTVGVEVQTLQTLNERMANEYLEGLSLLAPTAIIVPLAFALVIVVINRIALSRRLPEIGMLYATGLDKRWLTRRLTAETATLASVGWALGVGLSCLILYVLRAALFTPQGQDLAIIAWEPLALALPAPMLVIGLTFISARRVLSRLDPVAVVEQGERSLEEDLKRGLTASKSSSKPLASATFYRRHRLRAVLLISAMSLLIVAVVLVFFIDAVMADAYKPSLGYLSRMSLVRTSPNRSLDAGLVSQVRTHPAVERVIPVAPRYSLLSVHIPPFLTSSEASPFGVYAEDMAYLVELYGLELKEGRLPRPHTNEMVIPEAIAQNRGLKIGDVLGDPQHPAYPGAYALHAEFVISGIFARSPAKEDENWLGFVSLEFLESHQGFFVPDIPPLFVVPKAGQKEALDDWLESELAGRDASVLTWRQQAARAQDDSRGMLVLLALLESVIVVVAAVALAVLNHIFVSQRRSEFGLLHALGYGRLRLVWRVVGETAFTTGVAWGLSAILFLIGLLGLQLFVFTPLGLKINPFNPTPWLFTLPIPVVVLAVTGGAIARTLSKLDPVSVVERR